MMNVSQSVDEKISALPCGWQFDHSVAQEFDKHVRKSVPCYDQVQIMIADISEWFIRDGAVIFDLGTSTGETIARLQAKHQNKKDVRFIGIDNSLPMLEKAKVKCETKNVQFLHQNIASTTGFTAASLVTAIYTLQFLSLAERRHVIELVSRDLLEGGAFIIVEKIRAETSLVEDMWLELYWDMKQAYGLNPDQVLAKARSLRGVLVPLTLSENVKLLKEAGFLNIDVFMKWYNFVGILAVKNNKNGNAIKLENNTTEKSMGESELHNGEEISGNNEAINK